MSLPTVAGKGVFMSQDAVDHGSQRKQSSENTNPETSLFCNCWGWVRWAMA